MNDNAVMTRRTKVTRITQGDGLPPPLVVATAQQEERRTYKQLRTCHGTKNIDNVNRHDQGSNGSVTMSHPFHLSCRRRRPRHCRLR